MRPRVSRRRCNCEERGQQALCRNPLAAGGETAAGQGRREGRRRRRCQRWSHSGRRTSSRRTRSSWAHRPPRGPRHQQRTLAAPLPRPP
eukprot:scaffold1885_cov402-Prasinococcus_capsulatus_cf.AAC.16